jgi:hypothetical protein
MAWRVRDVFVTVAGAVLLAGPVAAVVVPALPPAWRYRAVPWAILVLALGVVAGFRRGRPPSS